MIEIERRKVIFFIESVIPVSQVRIVQIYLPHEQDDDRSTERIRRVTKEDGSSVFWHTAKTWLSPGVCQETETEITPADFKRLAANRLKIPISKTRISFMHQERLFELDEFHYPLEGLVILEVELPSLNEKVHWPKHTGFEVTGDPRYSNRQLFEQGLILSPEPFPEEFRNQWRDASWDEDAGCFVGVPAPYHFCRPKAVYSKDDTYSEAVRYFVDLFGKAHVFPGPKKHLIRKCHTQFYWGYSCKAPAELSLGRHL